MSRQIFVSDTHFGHRAILAPRMQAPRRFASIEEHDETLIARWNAAVRPDDTVWHLGDFCYRCSGGLRARSVFGRLRVAPLSRSGQPRQIGAATALGRRVRRCPGGCPRPDGVPQASG